MTSPLEQPREIVRLAEARGRELAEAAAAVGRLAAVVEPEWSARGWPPVEVCDDGAVPQLGLAGWVDVLADVARGVVRERDALLALEVAVVWGDGEAVAAALGDLTRLRYGAAGAAELPSVADVYGLWAHRDSGGDRG